MQNPEVAGGSEKNKPSKKNAIEKIWADPLGKFFLLSLGTVSALGAVGLLLRLLTWVKSGYVSFRDTGRGHGSAPTNKPVG